MRARFPQRLKRRPCVLTFTPLVTWDGKVRSCGCKFSGDELRTGVDDLLIGDLSESSLRDIVFGDAVKRLRRRFIEGDLPKVCRACTHYVPC